MDAAYANPDVEILNAVEPGLATTGGPLILASSPHARRGVLWEVFKRHYGAGGDPHSRGSRCEPDAQSVLATTRCRSCVREGPRPRHSGVSRASSARMSRASSALEVVEGCVGDYREHAPARGTLYRAFVDPASGSGGRYDVGDRAQGQPEISSSSMRSVRRGPILSPTAVVDDLPLCSSPTRHQSDWRPLRRRVREGAFRKHGISYESCKQPKSDLYRDLLPLLNSGRITLPRNDRLVAQIVGLERRVSRAGKDSIDHAPRDTTTLPTRWPVRRPSPSAARIIWTRSGARPGAQRSVARAPILEPRVAARLLVTCNQPFGALDGLTHDRLVVEQFGERKTVVTRLATRPACSPSAAPRQLARRV